MFRLATWAIVLAPAGALFVCAFLFVLTRSGRSRSSDGYERVLIVGAGPLAGPLAREIEARPWLRWRVIGIVADIGQGELPDVGPWLGPLDSLACVIASTQPTRIAVGPADRRKRCVEPYLLDARLRGIGVEDTWHVLERVTGKLPIERLSPRSLLTGGGFLHSDFSSRDVTAWSTRVLSVVIAALGLVCALPLFAVIAAAIRLDSRGPVFFVHPRIGMGGRPFNLVKFRTMAETGPRASEWVCDNHHRITRVGRWLRRFRLDELPQLVNVLRGEMNLVGPRPHPVSNYTLFLERIPHYRLRSAVRPGLTGWAQIRYGYANNLAEETEKMRYDLFYIKHRSIWLDLKILLLTAGVLVFDRRSHEAARNVTPARWTPPLSRTANWGIR